MRGQVLILLGIIGLYCKISMALSIEVDQVTGGTVVETTFDNFNDSDIAANAKTDWEFKEATVSPSGKIVTVTPSRTTTSSKTNEFNYVNFTTVLSGKILPTRAGKGTSPTNFSISGKHLGYVWEPMIIPFDVRQYCSDARPARHRYRHG